MRTQVTMIGRRVLTMNDIIGSLLLVTGSALAVPTDADGDGWWTETSPEDCDDGNTLVNPAAEEDGVDLVDDDCDGSLAIRREYVSGFETVGDWNVANATITAGMLTMSPETTSMASVELRGTLPFDSGLLTVVVSVEDWDPLGCAAYVTHGSTTDDATFTGTGDHVLQFPGVAPGESVSLVVSCWGFTNDEASIDWISVQNGG